MGYAIEFTGQYLKDLRLARKRELKEELLNEVIRVLASGEELHARYKDHALSGKYKNFRECHVTPDWLLVYKRENNLKILTLVRTGSHSDLFK